MKRPTEASPPGHEKLTVYVPTKDATVHESPSSDALVTVSLMIAYEGARTAELPLPHRADTLRTDPLYVRPRGRSGGFREFHAVGHAPLSAAPDLSVTLPEFHDCSAGCSLSFSTLTFAIRLRSPTPVPSKVVAAAAAVEEELSHDKALSANICHKANKDVMGCYRRVCDGFVE